MATLSSTSTLAEIDAEIVANLHYARRNSATMAEALVAACFWWRSKRPQSASVGGSSTSYDAAFIDRIAAQAQQWLAGVGADSAVDSPVRFSFQQFRD